MKTLSGPNEIWTLKPTKEDLDAGAKYAAITLPWTFNRMMLNTGSTGQNLRALNISKGIVAQEMLRRKLEENNIKVETQRKSYRDEDLFDFKISMKGEKVNFDLKTIHFFSDYEGVDREPLSEKYIVDNSNYKGPDWRRFFPMLIPHTQIKQNKEAYCFAIASSIDPRKNLYENRDFSKICAFPYGEHLSFFGSKKLIYEREENKKGFYIKIKYRNIGLFKSSHIVFRIIGEWDGHELVKQIELKPGNTHEKIGPFSCVSSFEISDIDHKQLDGNFQIDVDQNDFTKRIVNTSRRNINTVPKDALTFTQDDFCNLILPNDYKLYVLGWTLKRDFLINIRKYDGWVWPLDKVDKFKNQRWSQITEKDSKLIEKLDLQDCLFKNPSRIKAGLLKTHGRGGGACCYVFPNIGRNGGIKETNLYVLPSDLQTMDEL